MPRTPKPENLNSEIKEEAPSNLAYSVKKIDDETYAVVSKSWETVRTYKEEEGCEDPKACAKEYAAKLCAKM